MVSYSAKKRKEKKEDSLRVRLTPQKYKCPKSFGFGHDAPSTLLGSRERAKSEISNKINGQRMGEGGIPTGGDIMAA